MVDFLIKKQVYAIRCLRCKHEWLPRLKIKDLEKPLKKEDVKRLCPKCKSAYWDSYKEKRKDGKNKKSGIRK